jgi:MFS family permease
LNPAFFKEGISIHSRKFVAITILASGSISWLFFLYYNFESIFAGLASDPLLIYAGKALFLSCGAFSAIIGSAISGKVKRRKLLLSWITLGVLATASLAVFQGSFFAIFSSVLLGVSLGLGYPSFTALMADSTIVEERGRVSGFIILLSFVMVAFAVIAVSLFDLGLVGIVLLSVFLRATSYFALILDSCDREQGQGKSWLAILTNRNFSFYLYPLLMFYVATALISFVWTGLPDNSDYRMAFAIGSPLHFLGPAIFGLVAGFLADRFGRKQIIIVGLVMLGVSFALLGLYPSAFSVLVYLVISGVAWGFLIVIYLAVPGDVAFPGSREKFYAVGAIIPLLIYMGLVAISQLLNVGVPANVLSPILAIIVFVSVIPVLRASETLHEAKILERKMREHVKKVSELVQKSKKDE